MACVSYGWCVQLWRCQLCKVARYGRCQLWHVSVMAGVSSYGGVNYVRCLVMGGVSYGMCQLWLVCPVMEVSIM